LVRYTEFLAATVEAQGLIKEDALLEVEPVRNSHVYLSTATAPIFTM